MNAGRVHVGDLVWRNSDAALERALRGAANRPIGASVAQATREEGGTGSTPAETYRSGAADVSVSVSGGLGEPLQVSVVDAEGRVGEATSEAEFQAARSSPLTSEALRAAVGAMGGEGLVLGAFDDSELAGLVRDDEEGAGPEGSGLFMPTKAIKATRRAAVEELLRARRDHGRAEGMRAAPVLPQLLEMTKLDIARAEGALLADDSPELAKPAALDTSDGETSGETLVAEEVSQQQKVKFSVLCRTPAQVAAAVAIEDLSEVAVDFLEVHGLQNAVNSIRAAGKRVVVATPRVLKPDEERLWKFYLRLGADALLIRSNGLLHKLMSFGGEGAVLEGAHKGGLRVPELHGDFSLNAVNPISAGSYLALGLKRLTPGHDISAKQMGALAQSLGPAASRLEVIAHQHLAVFHTEHCVFCRFLSEGDNYTNCGHPCEINQLHLRDSAGKDHLVLADMGCRNTVFNAQAQSAIDMMPALVDSGVRRFRIELVDEPASAVAPLLQAYQQVVHEPSRAQEAWRWLQTLPDGNGNAQGVTLGSLEHKADLPRPDLKLTKTRQLYGQPGAEVQDQKTVMLRERHAGSEAQQKAGQPRGQSGGGGGRGGQRKARPRRTAAGVGTRRGRGAPRA